MGKAETARSVRSGRSDGGCCADSTTPAGHDGLSARRRTLSGVQHRLRTCLRLARTTSNGAADLHGTSGYRRPDVPHRRLRQHGSVTQWEPVRVTQSVRVTDSIPVPVTWTDRHPDGDRDAKPDAVWHAEPNPVRDADANPKPDPDADPVTHT